MRRLLGIIVAAAVFIALSSGCGGSSGDNGPPMVTGTYKVPKGASQEGKARAAKTPSPPEPIGGGSK